MICRGDVLITLCSARVITKLVRLTSTRPLEYFTLYSVSLSRLHVIEMNVTSWCNSRRECRFVKTSKHPSNRKVSYKIFNTEGEPRLPLELLPSFGLTKTTAHSTSNEVKYYLFILYVKIALMKYNTHAWHIKNYTVGQRNRTWNEDCKFVANSRCSRTRRCRCKWVVVYGAAFGVL